ncbi:MAG: hypothetical protein KF851_07620 [Pirellulaceae bacterium]|nr:hypothetical protein [Pirellulaceae bacterium]
MDFETEAKIFVTCHQGLAPWLEGEVTELGYSVRHSTPSGVALRGSLGDCIRLNLNLRCASQVLFSLGEFRCTGPDQLYRSARAIPWETILPTNGYFSVTSSVIHPTIRSTMFANVRVKDAVVDRLRKNDGSRPDCGAELSGAVVHLYWRGSSAELFLDTSGPTLAKHGYRKHPGAAPMMESLAAGTLLATRWDRRVPFINPMCGSGTLAIEAALLASNRRPGLIRHKFAFQHLIGDWKQHYTREMELLQNQLITSSLPRIIASDINPAGVEIARENAAAAGVADMIEFSVCDFRETPMPTGEPLVVFLNPEYGERLGDADELAATYTAIGDFFKRNCQNGWGYVFTGNKDLAKKIGLRTKRRLEFHTASLECRLLEFELYSGSRKNTVAD